LIEAYLIPAASSTHIAAAAAVGFFSMLLDI